MSWNNPPKTRGLWVTGLPSGVWSLAQAVPQVTEGGPDTLSLIYEGRFDTALQTAPSVSAFAPDTVPPGYAGPGTWRCVTAQPEQMYGPFWRCNVEAKGLLAAKDPVVRWNTGSSSFTADNVTIPVEGLVGHAAGRMPEVGVEISQVVFGTKPTTDAPGTMMIPPEPRPTSPTNWWSWISAEIAVYHYPYGWTLENIDADRITANLWWATWKYTYIMQISS